MSGALLGSSAITAQAGTVAKSIDKQKQRRKSDKFEFIKRQND
jgi:hypothetical protein